MHAAAKRNQWRTAVPIVVVGALFGARSLGCSAHGASDHSSGLPKAGTVDSAQYWSEQLRPRPDGDVSLELDTAQRYLDKVPESTRAQFAAQMKNPALGTCFQLAHVAIGRQHLRQFDVAVPYFDQLLARTDCPAPRTETAHFAAFARHGALYDSPPTDDPETLSKVAAEMSNLERSLPRDQGSDLLAYHIAVVQHWSGRPDAARLATLLSRTHDELVRRYVDLRTATVIYMAATDGEVLGDAELVQAATSDNRLLLALTGQDALR
jgi:hypothetical protein